MAQTISADEHRGKRLRFSGWVKTQEANEAGALAYGFFVNGAGKMWVSGAKLEAVGPEIASTNMNKTKSSDLPKAPVNLSFDPDHPK